MFARKLHALGFHHPDSFSIDDEIQVRNLVVWLEDKKIRLYKIEDRYALRDIQADGWVAELKKYLRDLRCPVLLVSNKASVLNWLMSHAVQLQYSENASHYNCSAQCETAKKNLFAAVDNSQLKKCIDSLSAILRMPEHNDPVTRLFAIEHIIQSRFSEHASNQTAEQKPNLAYLPLSDCSLGFHTTDVEVNEAAKVIRLLHINELRELQTRINAAIVAVQKMSADPKTDQSLGQVGR